MPKPSRQRSDVAQRSAAATVREIHQAAAKRRQEAERNQAADRAEALKEAVQRRGETIKRAQHLLQLRQQAEQRAGITRGAAGARRRRK